MISIKTKYRSVFLLLLFSLLSYSSFAQKAYNSKSLDHFNLKYRLWTMEEGMPHWRVRSLFVDSKGYLWLLNYEYLSRFDGENFEVMDTLVIGQKRPKRCTEALAEDNAGNIWYNTGEEIKVIEPKTRKALSLEEYIDGNMELPKIERSLKMFSIHQTVYVYLPTQGIIWKYNDSLDVALQDIEKQEGGSIFDYRCLPGPNNTWWFSDGKHVKRLSSQGENMSIQDSVLEEGSVLHYADFQLYKYNVLQTGGKPRITSFGDEVGAEHNKGKQSSAMADEASNLDVLTMAGGQPIFYDDLTGEVLNVQHELNINFSQEDFFQGIILQPIPLGNGVFVLHTPSQAGILQIELSRKDFKSLGHENVFRQIALKDDTTLLGFNKRGLFELDLISKKTQAIPIQGQNAQGVNLSTFKISSLTVYGDYIYVGFYSYSGFVRLDKNYKTDQVFLESTHKFETKTLLPLSENHVIVASNQDIKKVNLQTKESETLRIFSNPQKLNCLFKDKSGDLWAGTSLGLYNLKTDSAYIPKRINKFNVSSIYEDTDGSFWITTLNGLYKWKPFSNSFNVYNGDNDFISGNLYCAYSDTLGRLWMTGNRGVIAFDLENETSVNFTKTDGLSGTDFNRKTHAISGDGNLYFGTVDGLTQFNPNSIPKQMDLQLRDLELVKIEQLNGAGEMIPTKYAHNQGEPMLIDRSCIQTVLHLSMPHFNQRPLNYSWRISGFYPQWTNFKPSQGLSISGMPHGDYTLEVKVSEKANPNFSQVFNYSFKKEVYIYQNLWFQILIVLTLALLVWLTMVQRSRLLNRINKTLEEQVSSRTQELKEQNKTIVDQKEKLERIDALKSELFNNISHEIRTPLSIIKVQADLINQKLGKHHELTKDVDLVASQADSLALMMDDVMSLSKLQMGILKNHPKSVDWHGFINRTFAMFDGLARKKRLAFRLEVEPNSPTYIQIDVSKVERILVNLIENAIKFTPEVGRILVQSEYNDGTLKIKVRDTGPGIRVKEQENIFKRYQQGVAASKTDQLGYGIGLAICKEFTELIDGKIWVESSEGDGSTFFLEISAAKTTDKETRPMEFPKELEDNIALLSDNVGWDGHILVVEDNPDLLNYLGNLFSKKYRVTQATNGQQAWSLLQKYESIDVVISDAMMPLMDGFTLLQKTRSDQKLGFKPFILLTALTAEDERLKGLRLGVDAYVTKPFDVEELKARVINLVARQKNRKTGITQVKSEEAVKNIETSEEIISFEEEWLIEVEEAVKKNLQDSNFKVPDLAFVLHISDRTLFSKLKVYTGLKPSEYIRKARLELAMHYIKARKFATVKELSHSVGINNTAHFVTLFKKEFGMTPSVVMKAI